jgi:uncharacterized membrane protein (UPF0127 family)
MRIKIGFRGKKVSIGAKELSNLGMFRGLMVRGKNCDNLLFNRKGKWAIHSFFVFFPFLALWLDENNDVIEHKIVKPFSFHVKPERNFVKLVEMPFNDKNKQTIDFLVDRERFKYIAE